jgi:regulator of RNase E activity RraA
MNVFHWEVSDTFTDAAIRTALVGFVDAWATDWADLADDDGAVVIPQDLVEFVAAEGDEHERYESWVVSEVERGVPLPGLYPPNDEAKARYQAWKRGRG